MWHTYQCTTKGTETMKYYAVAKGHHTAIYYFNGVKEFAERHWPANERINQNYQSVITSLK